MTRPYPPGGPAPAGPYPPARTPGGPVLTRPWSPARTPAFWLLVVVVAVGALGPLVLLGFGAWVAPRSALAALPLLAGYAALSLVVLRWLDQLGRRPWWLVLLAFGWGATVAVMVGAFAGYTLDVLLAQLTSPGFAAAWGPALIAPTVEETAKGAGVLLLLLAARPHLRTPFAGAVYGAVVGVGFATVEDLSYALTAADETLPDHASDALRVVALRAVLPGLVGHPLFTALVGAGIGYAVLRADRPPGRRWAVLAGGAGLAWLAHAAVNSPLALHGAEALDRLPVISPMAGYFLVIGVPGALAWYALAVLRRREAGRLTAGLVAPQEGPGPVFGVATRGEATLLATVWTRARTVRAVRREHGRAAARALRRLYAAQLAFLDLPAPPGPPPRPAWPVDAHGRPLPLQWPAAAPGWPVEVHWPAATPAGRARVELAAARTRLGELTGSVEAPAAPDTPAAPRWLVPGAVVLGVAGLVHWLVPLLAAVALANRRQRPAPLAVAVAATGYVWLTGALLALLYPGG